MTYIVSSGALNSTHSLTHYTCRLLTAFQVHLGSLLELINFAYTVNYM